MHSLAHTYTVSERETILSTPDVRVQILGLAKDQVIPWHKHTIVDDTFICLEGITEIQIALDQPFVQLKPGERYVVKAGIGHAVRDARGTGTRFVLLQATGKHDFVPLSEPGSEKLPLSPEHQ